MRKKTVILAMAAILLCGCVGAGFVIQNGGARSGREYIRENV